MNKFRASIFLVFSLAMIISNESIAKIEYVTVTSQGSGINKSEAIKDALQEAVSQVNGAQVAAQTASSVSESYKESNGKEDYEISDDFKKNIKTKTKGVVREWGIISESSPNNDSSVWDVVLSVTVAKYKESKQVSRLRMAVIPFKLAPTIKDKKKSSDFEHYFVNSLTSYLTQTRRFAMLDRQFKDEQQAELNLIQGENFKMEEMGRLGNQLGTDYLISGTIDNVSQFSNTKTMRTTGKKITTTTSKVDFSFRIFDVTTGLIKNSGTYSKVIPGSVSVQSMADKAANKIGQEILNAIYPITVVSIEGELLVLGQGGGTIKVGDQLKLVKYGNKIIDPYTKESLGFSEIEIGVVQVISVQAKTSTAEIVQASIDVSSEQSRMIVRPIQSRKKSAPKRPVKKLKKEIKVEMDDFSKDEDW